jgi:hypothetical protein
MTFQQIKSDLELESCYKVPVLLKKFDQYQKIIIKIKKKDCDNNKGTYQLSFVTQIF